MYQIVNAENIFCRSLQSFPERTKPAAPDMKQLLYYTTHNIKQTDEYAFRLLYVGQFHKDRNA